MNDSLQEGPDIQETWFGGPSISLQPRLIHFSSGETMEMEDSEEEEEEEEDDQTFTKPADKAKWSWRTVGRISLYTCDFLGEKLAGLLGLNAAKYQYAIDEYHRDGKSTVRPIGSDRKRVERIHLSSRTTGEYGATRSKGALGSQACDDEVVGSHNKGYQGDEEH